MRRKTSGNVGEHNWKETNNNEKDVEEAAEREMEEEGLREGSRQKLSRNIEQRKNKKSRQMKSIYNFLSAVKHKISRRNSCVSGTVQTLTVQMTAPYLQCTVHAH